VNGSEFRDILPKTREIRLAFCGIVPPVHVRVRPQFAEVGGDKGGLVAEFGFDFQARLELIQEEEAVYRKGAEAFAVFVIQIVDNQLG
jgi:hypothetical protein